MNRRLLAAIVLSAALTGPAAQALPVYVNIAPPVPRVEVQIAAPGPGYVWTPGYYAWRGGAYVWVGGAWALPPRPHAVWVAGHWRNTPAHGWYWRPGHWR
jgi:WXXGXW repeat (2 copies)